MGSDDDSNSSMMSDEEVEKSSGGESSIDELDHMIEEDDESSNETPLQYNYEYIPQSDKHTISNEKKRERIQKIEAAATTVQSVIKKYGEASLPSINPDDTKKKGSWDIDSSSPWADPSLAMKEIISAKEELCKAWDNDNGGSSGDSVDGIDAQQSKDKDKWWKSVLHTEDNNNNNNICSGRTANDYNHRDGELPLTKEEEQQFQEIYMEFATNAFSRELEALRKGELGTLTLAKRKGKSTETKNDISAVAPAVELDPTQYSFIVENNMKRDVKRVVEQIDVQVLGDMMASGSYALSNTEKRMLLQARKRAIERIEDSSSSDRDDDDVGISLHERRKLELGF